jgi:hypothetical protein
MKIEIVGFVCLILVFSATQAAAQTQPPPAQPQRTAPRPPAPAAAAAGSPYCLFESKEYSIGAVLCASSQMSQVCTAPDTEHSRSWWSSGPQSLCAGAAPTHAPAQPSILTQPSIPKSAP